jgi:hypothetical protein
MLKAVCAIKAAAHGLPGRAVKCKVFLLLLDEPSKLLQATV